MARLYDHFRPLSDQLPINTSSSEDVPFSLPTSLIACGRMAPNAAVDQPSLCSPGAAGPALSPPSTANNSRKKPYRPFAKPKETFQLMPTTSRTLVPHYSGRLVSRAEYQPCRSTPPISNPGQKRAQKGDQTKQASPVPAKRSCDVPPQPKLPAAKSSPGAQNRRTDTPSSPPSANTRQKKDEKTNEPKKASPVVANPRRSYGLRQWLLKFVDLGQMVRDNNGEMTYSQYCRKMCSLHTTFKRNRCNIAYFEMQEQHKKYHEFVDIDCIDLHYLPAALAESILEQFIRECFDGERSDVVYVVTGAGNNSRNGDAVIKKQVKNYARKNRFECEEIEGNEGVLIITLPSTCKNKSNVRYDNRRTSLSSSNYSSTSPSSKTKATSPSGKAKSSHPPNKNNALSPSANCKPTSPSCKRNAALAA